MPARRQLALLAARVQNQAALRDGSDCPREWSVFGLCCASYPVSLKCARILQRYLPRLNNSIRGKFQRSHGKQASLQRLVILEPYLGEGATPAGFLTTSS